MVRIAIITYSTYGHIDTLAKAVQAGIEEAGGAADVFRVAETLSDDVLEQMNAPPKPAEVPVADENTLKNYDAFVFGIPTSSGTCPRSGPRSGTRPARCGRRASSRARSPRSSSPRRPWAAGRSPPSRTSCRTLSTTGSRTCHWGTRTPSQSSPTSTRSTGVPWGPGRLAGADGSRSASDLEQRIARIQGKTFYQTAVKFFPSAGGSAEKRPAAKKPAEQTATKKTAAAPAAKRTAAKEEPKKDDAKKEDGGMLSCCTVM
ncbi:flavodoxin-like fold family protein KNAG_0I01110 [Huiozyma naganishii CBS 8797]|uniref:Flavodoxin-like domain-containing protein n=1 Tax=Huiozyma naganishii (strain ATCC MYA-139 / BCRC 22969 / CBS 8797 / KCTC 17520 / NBRC 10181 / NCYC 3082 / Yp74L-3) TaxID=1071383 RepID=J7S290_HUIN7|nr:hypothetical protein KNAG_0I01110 [Kazachstania naganishii CBS 8797]CCK71902.1 hypothetical protein KNAG_0I01110 [Kazachstania naganishii CBS 8797]